MTWTKGAESNRGLRAERNNNRHGGGKKIYRTLKMKTEKVVKEAANEETDLIEKGQ